MRQRVLFLCTHTSARSQMAEGFLRHIASDRFEVESAGSEATGVHPMAVKAMREIGIDISGHPSNTLRDFAGQPFDYVITVCDWANKNSPAYPADTKRIHWSFDDPAAAGGTDEERMQIFRRVRDEIRQRLLIFRTIAAPR